MAIGRFQRRHLWGLGLGLCALALVLLTVYRNTSGLNVANTAYEGTPLQGVAAPDFHLTDHQGNRVALSDFQGKVVVLTFLDSRCQEVCPLTAAQLRLVYRALGSQANSVVFVGINVNLQAAEVADVATATDRWSLNEIVDWRFLTGRPDELEPVWKAYSIGVEPASDPQADLTHTSGVYVIDRLGREQWYLSGSLADPASGGLPLNAVLAKRIQGLLSQDP